MKQTKFYEVYRQGKRLLTRNLIKGKSFDEIIIKEKGVEYRVWDIRRSKLAAAIAKGISQIGLKPNDIVLYLGASYGQTASYISDIVGEKGFVFALDFAPRSTRDLYFLCLKRKNITPLLEDAFHPENYKENIVEVDFLYQDIAQRNQAEIFIKNLQFLKKDGFAVLCIKARSIDVTKKPKQVFNQVRNYLEKYITIVDYRTLEPFERDHCVFVCKKK